MFCLWNCSPRMPWQTPSYYASEAATLTDVEFNRMHRNQWGTSENTFIPYAWWEACKGELPTFARGVPIVIGIDAAVSGDCFAMVGVSRLNRQTYVRFIYVLLHYTAAINRIGGLS